MYPYHNRIKQRINAGELVSHYKADNYPGIGPALVLVFNTAPFLRPIRPHRWPEYENILKDWRDRRDAGRAESNGQGNYHPGDCCPSPGL